MSVAMKVSVGRSGTASANARYITRESATEGEQERVWTRNVPEYADRADDQEVTYRERVADLREFSRQMEEDELERPHRGNGERRTHYRAMYSFDERVTDEKAKEMVNRHLEQCFPKARVIAAIHRDTDHAHVHVQIAARDAEGKKLHLGHQQFRTIDEKWARIYGREFGQQHEREHLAKKAEWREWMRAARAAKEQGHEIPQRPEREAQRRNQVRERIQMAERQYGKDNGSISREVTGDAEQRAARADQRSIAHREPELTSGQRANGDRICRPTAIDRGQAHDGASRHRTAANAERGRDRQAVHGADHRASRAAGDSDGPGDRGDGAGARAGRGADGGSRRAAAEADSERRGAKPAHQDVYGADRAGQGRDPNAARSGPADEGKLLRPDRGAVAQRAAVDRAGDDRRELGGELRRAADHAARPARDRGEPELAHPDLRSERAAIQPLDGRDQGQARADLVGDGQQSAAERGARAAGRRAEPAEHGRHAADGSGAGERQRAAAHDERQALTPAAALTGPEQREQRTAISGAQLLQMMDEAARPVAEREAREQAERQAQEQARRAAAEARAAREAAERARALIEQQRREEVIAEQRRDGALVAANKTAERELHGLMKEHGAMEALRDPRTIEQLGRAMERTLKEHDTKMPELGWTRENLREQLGAYTKEIAKDPDRFMQRMEPLKEHTRERGREIEHDRGRGHGWGMGR